MSKKVDLEFQERIKEFNLEIVKLQDKFQVSLYAVYCLNPVGELIPMIKVNNRKPIEEPKKLTPVENDN